MSVPKRNRESKFKDLTSDNNDAEAVKIYKQIFGKIVESASNKLGPSDFVFNQLNSSDEGMSETKSKL